MLPFPNIDPIAFTIPIVELPIHWYAISYIAAFLVGSWWLKKINAKHPAKNLTNEAIESLFVWIVVGVILGGRLGFVIFYHLPHYMENPLEILKTWQGGMSFHGGLIGVIIAGVWFCKRHKIKISDIADRLACVVPIGLLFGRLANYVNGELWGKEVSANFPLATIFPQDPLQITRHPSQLYEAGLEGLLLFMVLYAVTRNGFKRWQATGIFLAGYGASRFGVEFFRAPDHYAYIETVTLSSGQLLSVPMIIAGLCLIAVSYKSK